MSSQLQFSTAVAAASSYVDALSPMYVKGTLKVISKAFRHLSPAVGCALSFSELIVSLYEHVPANFHTAELTRRLFWRASSTEPLKPTRNKSKVAFWLTPTLIGHLIGIFESSPINLDEALLPYLKQISITSGGEKAGLTLSKVRSFAKLIENSMEECSRPRSPFYKHCTTGILLAFLWSKCEAKYHIQQYLAALYEHIPQAISKKTLLFTSTWETTNFKPDNSTVLGASIPDTSKVSSRGVERAIYKASYARLCQKGLPPMAQYKSYLPTPLYGRSRPTEPDCFETALRNILYFVLWNPILGCLDARMLPVSVKPPKNVLEYLQVKRVDVNSMRVGQEWFDIVSNIPGARYIRTGDLQDVSIAYELYPSTDNLLFCLNWLLGKASGSIHELFSELQVADRQFAVAPITYNSSYQKAYISVAQSVPLIGTVAIMTVTVELGHHTTVNLTAGTPVTSEASLPAWINWTKDDKFESVIAPMLALALARDTSFFRSSMPQLAHGVHPRHCALAVLAGPSGHKVEMIKWALSFSCADQALLDLYASFVPIGSPDARGVAQYILQHLPSSAAALISVIIRARFPLHLATEANHLPVVRILLAKNYDPNERDEFGHTALSKATSSVIAGLLQGLYK